MAFNPEEISKMMMQGYIYNTRPLEECIFVKDKAALVSGGTSGLGFCVANRLLQGGANVVISSFSEAEAETAIELFSAVGYGGDRVRFYKADVTKESEMEAVVDFTAETFDSLDIVVNCAGIWNYAHIYDMPEDAFMKVIDVNLNGTFRLAKYASRYMVDHDVKGKMVFVSSDCYTMPYPVFGGYPHYAASKGGILALTTEIARELKRFGIMVNTVAPGPMATPGGIKPENSCVSSLPEEKKAEFMLELKNPKTDQDPDTDAVALAVYMMCTNLGDSITGECILANSGLAHGCKVRQPAIEEYPPQPE